VKEILDKKLAVDPKEGLNYGRNDEIFRKIAKEQLLKFGKLSPLLLMRKLKCTASVACGLIKELNDKK
jgi:hypothetical protein